MKNWKWFFFVVLLSYVAQAQKVIAEVPVVNGSFPLQYVYLPNLDRLVCISGEKTNKVYGNIIHAVNSYDTDGFVEKIIQNDKLVNCVFSPIENAFLVAKVPNTNTYPDTYKLVLDGVASKYFNLTTGFRYFNDIYGFNIVNQDNSFAVDLQKDTLFLNVIDIFSNQTQQYKLNKPDLFRLENKITAKYTEGLNFDVRINESNIGIITKAINKNYKSATLYRTRYSLTGELLDDIAYSVSVPKHFLIFSNNGGGIIAQNEEGTVMSDLTINNFVVDKATEEVYVYGLFGKEGKAANYLKNMPLGVYVFKYDKNGKLLWESVQYIVDVLGFNQAQEMDQINLSLKLRQDEAVLSVQSSSNSMPYVDFITLNTANGEKLQEGNSTTSKPFKNKEEYFVSSNLGMDNYSNKIMDTETIVAAQLHPGLQEYLKKQNSAPVKLFYKTFFSKKGYWVIETDNARLYRVLFFR